MAGSTRNAKPTVIDPGPQPKSSKRIPGLRRGEKTLRPFRPSAWHGCSPLRCDDHADISRRQMTSRGPDHDRVIARHREIHFPERGTNVNCATPRDQARRVAANIAKLPEAAAPWLSGLAAQHGLRWGSASGGRRLAMPGAARRGNQHAPELRTGTIIFATRSNFLHEKCCLNSMSARKRGPSESRKSLRLLSNRR